MIIRQPRLLGAVSGCTRTTTRRAIRAEQRRQAHTIPKLQNENTIRSHGIGQLFSPAGFQMAWDQEMNYLIMKLNAITMNTPEENKSVKDLLIQYARDPGNAALFNYASMTHNTHFFFEGLNHSKERIAPPAPLVEQLEKDFASIDDLRTSLLDTADAMFGPGFVWLVRARVSAPDHPTSTRMRFRILPTYHAGSPYAGAHFRQQSLDMATQPGAGPGGAASAAMYREAAARGLSGPDFARQTRFQNAVGAFGPASWAQRDQKVSKGGVEVEPLLCVSTWEHAWIRDWGVYMPDGAGRWRSGKRSYLEAFWNTIDWEVVWRRCEESARADQDQSRRQKSGGVGSNAFMF